MLSLERCREILGDEAPADDRELEAWRDEAHCLARLLFEMYCAETGKNMPASLTDDADK
jgi:hypothetical protein